MKHFKLLTSISVFCAMNLPQGVQAENKNYLLINLTSYTMPESRKAIEYAKPSYKKGVS